MTQSPYERRRRGRVRAHLRGGVVPALLVLSMLRAAPVAAQPPAQCTEPALREQARAHFDKGIDQYDKGALDGALAEFRRSREICPTRAATENVARCLEDLGQIVEALAMYERLLSEFPNASAASKQQASDKAARLRQLVETLEIASVETGAAITVDGVDKGTTPAAAPIRVEVGWRVVRVYKAGFEVFDARVDVGAGKTVRVTARLIPLTRSGRLKVVEQTGKALDVVVDNVVVGKTPWEGVLEPGEHAVLLRGEGDFGTQPASVPVRANQVTPITLVAETLAAFLRVQPTPAGASVALDGVSVGRGSWEGRLRAGAHRIEVAAEGFLPQARETALRAGRREVVTVRLERDPTSTMWSGDRGGFSLEIDAGLVVLPSFGGDIAGCAACAAPPGIGVLLLGRGGYRFRTGLVLGIEAGYLLVRQRVTDRATSLTSVGYSDASHRYPGVADDTLTLGGLLLGASLGLRVGSRVPVTVRLGSGVLLGTLTDARTGRFDALNPPEIEMAESRSLALPYLTPEVRISLPFGKRFELSAGVKALVLAVPSKEKWLPGDQVHDAEVMGRTQRTQFANDVLIGKALLLLTPGLGARYEL